MELVDWEITDNNFIKHGAEHEFVNQFQLARSELICDVPVCAAARYNARLDWKAF